MSELRHIVCPACATTNRIPESRFADKPGCGKCHKALFAGQVVELDDATLDKHLRRNDVPLVVDFWAPWCGPCKMMAPAYARAAAQLEPHIRLAKINTEDHPHGAGQFGIRSIPTLIVFRDGREIARHSGAMMESDIVRWVRTSAGT